VSLCFWHLELLLFPMVCSRIHLPFNFPRANPVKGLVVRNGLDGDLAYNKPASPERRSGLDGDLAYNKPASPERRSGLDGDLAYNKPASPERRSGLDGDLAYNKPASPE